MQVQCWENYLQIIIDHGLSFVTLDYQRVWDAARDLNLEKWMDWMVQSSKKRQTKDHFLGLRWLSDHFLMNPRGSMAGAPGCIDQRLAEQQSADPVEDRNQLSDAWLFGRTQHGGYPSASTPKDIERVHVHAVSALHYEYFMSNPQDCDKQLVKESQTAVRSGVSEDPVGRRCPRQAPAAG